MQSPVVTFGPNLGIPNDSRRSNFTARRPSNIWWRQNFVPVVASYFSIVLIFMDILQVLLVPCFRLFDHVLSCFIHDSLGLSPWTSWELTDVNSFSLQPTSCDFFFFRSSKQSKQVADHARRIKNLVRAYNQVLQEESTSADRLFGSGEVLIGFEGSPTYPNMDGLEMFRTAQEWIVDKSVNFSNLGFLEQIMKIPSMFW